MVRNKNVTAATDAIFALMDLMARAVLVGLGFHRNSIARPIHVLGARRRCTWETASTA
jgi:hypothetical protein